MADGNRRQIEKSFDDALGEKEDERREFIIRACGGNQILLREVELFFSAPGGAESFSKLRQFAKAAKVIEPETSKLEREKRFAH